MLIPVVTIGARGFYMVSIMISIGELARLTGCKVETIRYYERTGLLANPPRTEGGHRAYGQAHLQRLSFVRKARALGFSMEQINSLLAMADAEHPDCATVAIEAERHLVSVRPRIEDLQKLEQTLSDTLAQCHRGDQPNCAILDVLQDTISI